jgi:hypothetical protein
MRFTCVSFLLVLLSLSTAVTSPALLPALHPCEVAAARFATNLLALASHQAVRAAPRHEPSVAQLLRNPVQAVLATAPGPRHSPSVAQLLQSVDKSSENFRRSEARQLDGQEVRAEATDEPTVAQLLRPLEHGQEERAEATDEPTVAQLLRNRKQNHEDVQRLENKLDEFTAHLSDGARHPSQIQTTERERQMQTQEREGRMQTPDRTGIHTVSRVAAPAPESARTTTIIFRDKHPVDGHLKSLVNDQV